MGVPHDLNQLPAFSLIAQERINAFGSDIKMPMAPRKKRGFLDSCPTSDIKCTSECSCMRAEENGPAPQGNLFWKQSVNRVVIPNSYAFQESQCDCLNSNEN